VIDAQNRVRCTLKNKNRLKRNILDIQCVIISSDDVNFNIIRTEDLKQNTIMALRPTQEYTFLTHPVQVKPHIRVKLLASNALGIKKFYEYTRIVEQNEVKWEPSKGTHCVFG